MFYVEYALEPKKKFSKKLEPALGSKASSSSCLIAFVISAESLIAISYLSPKIKNIIFNPKGFQRFLKVLKGFQRFSKVPKGSTKDSKSNLKP